MTGSHPPTPRPTLSRVRTMLISAIWLCAAGSAQANKGTLDQAVEVYLQGFPACTDANNLLLTDVQLAQQRFTIYQQYLTQATEINAELLTTTERGMPGNLQFCQRVENNIGRALATPILEQGFTYCDAAREALQRDDLDQTDSLLAQYRQVAAQAFAISNTLMDVYILASQVRNCTRLEERLNERRQTLARQHEAIANAISLSERFKLECESTLAYVRSDRFGVLQLDQANAMLASAQTHKLASLQIPEAQQFQREHPTHDLTLDWENIQTSARACEGEVTEQIRATRQEGERRRQVLTNAAARLREAQRYCARASDLSQPDRSREELAEARLQHQQSASIIDDIDKLGTPGQYAKLYPNWPEGAAYNQVLRETQQCLVTAAGQMRKLQTALEQQPEPPPTPAELSPPEDLLSDDLPIDPEFEFEDDADKDAEQRGGRRDWTDLVR